MNDNKTVLKKVIAIDMLLLCFSFNVSIVGQMLGSIKEVYFLNLTQASLLLSVQSIGGLALTGLCILFIDSFNKTKILVCSGLILCLSLITIGITPPLAALFIIFIIMGFSGGAINILTNTVMVETVPDKSEKSINFMHMIFSLGAVIAPLLSQSVYAVYGLQGVFFLFGGFALCWAVYSVYAFSPQMKKKMINERFSLKERFDSMVSVFKKPGIKTIFLIAFLISAWQLTAIYYISSFFTNINGNAVDGAIALSVLFFGMMVSRLLYTKIADRFSKGRVLLITNALGFLVWLSVFVVPGTVAKIALVGLSALFCGNNFPIIFSSACKIAPKNTATASGIVSLGYYIAVFAFIPVIGSLGDAIGLQYALLGSGLPLLVMIPAAYVLHKKMR